MKKIFAIILAVCLLAAVIPMYASAATSGTTGDCSWSVSGTVLTVTGNGAMEDYTFKKINNKNFSTAPWPTDITEVVISDGVTYIGNCSFVGCANLTKVTMANSVLSTGTYVFQECVSLSDVTLSEQLKKINDYIFYKCSALQTIDVPESVEQYGKAVFYDAGLKSIEFSDNVTLLDEYLFRGCKDLASIKFGKKISVISSSVFLDCSSITEIAVPDTVTVFDTSVFKGCTNLKTVTIGKGIEMIPMFAFAGCTSLETVYIPAKVTYIDMMAFQNSNAISDVYYGGDESDIYVDETENGALLDAQWHYNYVPAVTGAAVSGTVKSFGDAQENVIVQLIADGTSEAAYEAVVNGNNAAYEIKNVVAGNYSLKVIKKNHTTRIYSVTVAGTDVTQNAEIRLYGDINGDGITDKKDLNILKKHINMTGTLTGYDVQVLNFNDDKVADKKDLNHLKKHINHTDLLY